MGGEFVLMNNYMLTVDCFLLAQTKSFESQLPFKDKLTRK